MNITNTIKLSIEGKDIQHVKLLLDSLTYKNPEYFQKMNMGLSVRYVPKILKTYELYDRNIIIARGEFYKVKEVFPNENVVARHPEHEIDLLYVNNDFQLDNFQQGAIENIKAWKQGVVHAVTSAGKSLIILKAICELKQRALIVVHRKVLMEQFLQDIDKYIRNPDGSKITPGIFGDGKLTLGPITVAIDKTLSKHINEYAESFGTVILDECHLAPANTLYSLMNALNSKHRYGFTGTLVRKDQKQFLIHSIFGRVIAKIGKDELLELNRVVPVKVEIVETNTQVEVPEDISPTRSYAYIEQKLSEDEGRVNLIVDLAGKLPGKTIVLSRFVEPCYQMKEILQSKYPDMKIGVITGRNSKEALESYNQMKHSDMKVIFATIGCVSTGVSISDLDNIILTAPMFTNEGLLHQIRGRLMRTSEGKTHGTLYFIYDPYVFPGYKLNRFLSIMRK